MNNSLQKTSEESNSINQSNFKHWLYILTGISGLAIAIGYIFITACFIISGAPLPTGAEEWIAYMAGKSNLWWVIIWLSVITDVLYIPLALGLYYLLKNVHKGMMLISVAFFNLFVVLELAIGWSNYAAIIELISKYNLATTNVQRTLYLSAIEYTSTVLETPIPSFYSVFIPSMAVILASIVMLKSKDFSKVVPIIGLISGICNAFSYIGGLFSETLGLLVIPGSSLSIFWFLGIGIKFLKISREQSSLS